MEIELGNDPLQVLQSAVWGRNSWGSLIVEVGIAALDDVFAMARAPILDGLVASASMLPTTLVAALTTLSRIPVASAIALCTCWRTLDIIAAWPKSGAAELNVSNGGARLARSAPCETTLLAIFYYDYTIIFSHQLCKWGSCQTIRRLSNNDQCIEYSVYNPHLSFCST